MNRSSILSLLLLSLAACGGADSAGEAAMSTGDRVVPTSDRADTRGAEGYSPRVAVEPPTASGPAAGVDGGAAAGAAPAAEIQVGAADTAAYALPEPGNVPGMAAVSLNPMLVRTGRAVVQVDSLEEGIARVRALARRVGGIVGNTTISAGTDEARRAEMELRIPSLNFDAAAGGLSAIGTVQSVNVSAEDVGEEYTDVSARVVNARQMEARLLELLANREGRLEEVLNMEREVARVREEIERYEGRLRYLRTRASISVLTVSLHEGRSPIGTRPGERPIRDAFLVAWRSFIGLLAGVIASLGVLIPLGLLSWVAWRAVRRYQRRERAREAVYRETLRRDRAAPAPAPAPAAEVEEPVGSGAGGGTTDY